MRRPFIPCALGALVLTAVTVSTLTLRHQAVLDRPLQRALAEGGSNSLRTLIRITPGSASRVIPRLEARGARLELTSTANLYVAQLPTGALSTVASDSDVIAVSSDAPVRSMATLSSLTQNILLGDQALLTRTYTGKNIGVAVVDSGFIPSADLGNVTASYDFTSGAALKVGPKDPFGHGTHVAGLIGSTGSTTGGLYQGIAPGVRFIVLKALDQNGVGYTSNVINAINFAVANKKTFGIDIINLSLGHPIYEPAASDPLVQAVERAVASGIVVVASAGNFGGDPATHESAYGGISSPGNAPDAITVGAVETYQTTSRVDDVVAWYSSRGPSWYDGFQKPDVVAPGSHLASNVSSNSTLLKQYPKGIIATSGTCDLMRLSGTSMSAAVVSGIVATILDASRTNHPGTPLSPNAVKAILQFTALPVAGYDTLTQGAGAVNAAGAIALAAAIDPNAPLYAGWLTKPVMPFTTIAGRQYAWGQRVVWGDRVIWGTQVYMNDPAWAQRVVWGDRVIWGNRVIWGTSTVWDGNQLTWGNRVIWGNTLLGQSTSSGTQWGGLDGTANATRVIWGNLAVLQSGSTSLSWGNLERANMDIK